MAYITIQDIEEAFSTEGWEVSLRKDDSIVVENSPYTALFKEVNVEYEVSIESVEDSSDSEKKETDKPLEFINKFLGLETVGKISSSPRAMSQFIRHVASIKDVRVASMKLRRLLLSAHAFSKIAKVVTVDEIVKEFEKRKWEVEDQNDKHIEAKITDSNGDVTYNIKLEKTHIEYSYEFNDDMDPKNKKTGKTKDPVVCLQSWMYNADDGSMDGKPMRERVPVKQPNTPKEHKERQEARTEPPPGQTEDYEYTSNAPTIPAPGKKSEHEFSNAPTMRPNSKN